MSRAVSEQFGNKFFYTLASWRLLPGYRDAPPQDQVDRAKAYIDKLIWNAENNAKGRDKVPWGLLLFFVGAAGLGRGSGGASPSFSASVCTAVRAECRWSLSPF